MTATVWTKVDKILQLCDKQQVMLRARLCYYTLPPASFTSHIGGEQTAAMKKAIDCKILITKIKKILKL
ncbi:unnamed protein product [Ranitomeya imitator]|uniref:Uncharacterized protein n=1 Tax=Ranitomeya imitator TaxID=111125 RepID=A0ABN9L8H7_9NEOB|nr:unnamed protein product [Ranitomeya imitator]